MIQPSKVEVPGGCPGECPGGGDVEFSNIDWCINIGHLLISMTQKLLKKPWKIGSENVVTNSVFILRN